MYNWIIALTAFLYRYKEAFDDSEYVSTMPDDDGDDDDSPVESEWGAPAADNDDSDV